MKRSFVKIIVTAALLVATVFVLASCDMLPESVTSLIGGKKECTHSNVEWVVDTPATCKVGGIQHSVCSDCGKIVDSGVATEKGDHTPGEWEVKVTATCNRVGKKIQKCTVCKKEVTSEEIPLLTTHEYNYGKCNICKIDQPASTGLNFVSNGDGTCTITGVGSCADTSLVIPERSPAGDTVTAIGAAAFKDKAEITTLIVPVSVGSIASDAFSGCRITHATIPVHAVATVKSNYISELVVIGTGKIANGAMQGASTLRVLKMEEGITEVGENAFNGTSLKSIIMPSTLTVIGKASFANNDSLNLLTIGSGVVEIRDGAFQACSFIYTVNISASVVKIGTNAFYQCPRISTAVFENTEGWTIKNGGGYPTSEEMATNSYAASALKSGREMVRS